MLQQRISAARRTTLLALAVLLTAGVMFQLGRSEAAAVGKSNACTPATVPEPIVKKNKLPKGFVYLDEVLPEAQYEIRYYSSNNFTGTRVAGYKAPLAIFSSAGATALQKVSKDLAAKGYILHIYDAYRPQKAVNFFISWSKDTADIKMKAQYYPALDKRNLFKLGFISTKSGHTRGGTIDLTLADRKTGALVDMGSPYDFFGNISYYNTTQVTARQHANRKMLKDAMEKGGFKPYSKEWWHFTLVKEPYPNTYFDFDVE